MVTEEEYNQVCQERDELKVKVTRLQNKNLVLEKANKILRESTIKRTEEKDNLIKCLEQEKAELSLNHAILKHTMSRYEHFDLPWSLAKSDISIATDYPSTAPPSLVETIKQSVVEGLSEKHDLF